MRTSFNPNPGITPSPMPGSPAPVQPKRSTRCANTFAAIRHSILSKPLAIILALLLLGPLPQFPGWSLTPLASAQSLTTGQNAIIQTCCLPSSFEPNSVASFLHAHGIPATEAPLAYQYGRADLRNELRANLFSNILAIIKKDPSTRTTDEQTVYSWFQNIVWQNEQNLLSAAVLDYDAWKSNPCTWTPDPDVAQQYNLNYDGSQWCAVSGNLGALFTIAPPVPSKAYFLTAALKKTYGQSLAANAGVLAGMMRNDGAAAAVAVAGGLSVLGGVGAGLAITYFTVGAATGAAAASGLVSAGTGSLVLTGALGLGGPIAIVAMGVLIGAVAAFEVYESQQTLNELNTLSTDYNSILTNKPQLESFVGNQLGFQKLRMSFAANTLPDYPSTATPPGRRSGDRSFIITPSGGAPTLSPTFTYQGWSGTQWTAQPSGGWISAQGVTTSGATAYNFGVSIKFKGWDGQFYDAERNDLHFTVSKPYPQSGDTTYCAQDSTGNTPGNVSKCYIYVTDNLNLLDASGNKVKVRFTSFPLFTSQATFPANVDTTTQIAITADGDPLPTISSNGSLPPGFSLASSTPGSAQLTVAPNTAPGTYNLSLTADNGSGSPATQALTIIANIPVQILGPDSYSLYAGQHFSQVINVAGSPTPTLTCAGNSIFNAYATFTDNHNGTGTLAGTLGQETYDAAGNPVSPVPVQCNLTATNGDTTDTKLISIYGQLPPAATITSATNVTWVDNDTNELRVTTSVASGSLGTPSVSFSFPCGTGTNGQPSWMTFKDNGDGTAVLSGRPPFGTTSVPLLLVASTGQQPRCFSGIASGPNGLYYVPIPPNITINVQHIPVLPNAMYDFITVGVPANDSGFGSPAGGNGTVTGTPPPGVQFTAGPLSTWQLTGTPPVGSGGEYDMLYTASAATGTASGIFQIFVLEPPGITSLPTATFRTGQNNTFDVNTSGFPQSAIPGLRGPMQITLEGSLPQGVTFSDTNPEGQLTGTAVFSGTPPVSAQGTYPLTLTASNGVGSDAVQNFTLRVGLPGDVNLDGVVDCTDLDLVGNSFGYYIGQPNYNPDADLDNDGVVNWSDVTLVESNLPPGNSCVFAMGFNTMSAAVTTIGKSADFKLTSAFTLNPDSTGMDPTTSSFSLMVGNYSVTVPAGSFALAQNGPNQGSWLYSGTVKNVHLSVQIQSSGANAFVLNATAVGPGLSPLPNPVKVRIRIGENGGTISVVPN
jgi:hypothetical protein